jgi:hypothetical protein
LKIAIEIVDLPINSMVIFHSYVNVYQRVGKLKQFTNLKEAHSGTGMAIASIFYCAVAVMSLYPDVYTSVSPTKD